MVSAATYRLNMETTILMHLLHMPSHALWPVHGWTIKMTADAYRDHEKSILVG